MRWMVLGDPNRPSAVASEDMGRGARVGVQASLPPPASHTPEGISTSYPQLVHKL